MNKKQLFSFVFVFPKHQKHLLHNFYVVPFESVVLYRIAYLAKRFHHSLFHQTPRNKRLERAIDFELLQ